MLRSASIPLLAVLVTSAGGCTSSNPPVLPTGSAPIETSATGPSPAALAQPERTIIAQGTATDVYARVARGALRCWFGADGPLKATHIFNAEAASPAEGGAAEIVLHERDAAARDPRGTRAFRVSFVGEVTGVRVGVTPIKISDALAQPMVKDVETWASGGDGCQARALNPPPPPVSPPLPPAKSKGARNSPR